MVGKVFLFFVVVMFSLLILNLIIAILSNTYNIFDPKSNGLFLSKILASRDELQYDENYGAFLTSLTPLNFITLPFVPFAVLQKANPIMNNIVMQLQYIMLMSIMFVLFIGVSAILMPFAFLKSLLLKFKLVFSQNATSDTVIKLVEFIIFFTLGIGIMLLTFLADCYYFWANMFRNKLKKIVIERDPSTITMSSIKKIKMLAAKYYYNRIKAVFTTDYVIKFRDDLNIYA